MVLGNNEAGKSSIFQAIFQTLFLPSKLHKRTFANEMQRFIPIGGDTARAELVFTDKNGSYNLYKSWGGQTESKLQLADGTLITDAEKLKQALADRLPASPGVCKNILFGFQAKLQETIASLIQSKKEYFALGDILRSSAVQTDGISPERFLHALDSEKETYFANWDIANDYPKNQRGIHNPYKKNLGKILAAYYEKEGLRMQWQAAKESEEKYERLERKLKTIRDANKALTEFLRQYEFAYQELRNMETLQAQHKNSQWEYQNAKKLYDDWGQMEIYWQGLDRDFPKMQEQLAKLQQEQRQAKQQEEQKKLHDRYHRANTLQKEVDAQEEELAKKTQISRPICRKLSSLRSEIERLGHFLDASKIRLRMQAKTELKLRYQNGLAGLATEMQSYDLQAGSKFLQTAKGAFVLQTEDWELEVVTEGDDFEQKQALYTSKKQEYADLCQQYQVESPEEASQIATEYETVLFHLQQAKNHLEKELAGESLPNLEKKLATSLQGTLEGKSFAQTTEALYSYQAEFSRKQQEHQDIQNKLAYFQQTYQSRDHLFDTSAAKKIELSDLQKKIDTASQVLPKETDVSSFLRDYEFKQQQFRQQSSELHTLELQEKEVLAQAPEHSSEELAMALEDADRQYRKEKQYGNSLLRIEKMAESLQQTEENTYSRYIKDLEVVLGQLGLQQYDKVYTQADYPVGFFRSDGEVIPYQVLSTGTIHILSLAIRLIMAKYFLQEKQGFLILDDPLVELDPGRQAKAVQHIMHFAEQYQVIFFTCHPQHAKLFSNEAICI